MEQRLDYAKILVFVFVLRNISPFSKGVGGYIHSQILAIMSCSFDEKAENGNENTGKRREKHL